MNENKYYLRLDAEKYIVKGFSDAFDTPLETDIFIGEGGRQFYIDGFGFNPDLHEYKYIDGQFVHSPKPIPPQPPSVDEQLYSLKLSNKMQEVKLELINDALVEGGLL